MNIVKNLNVIKSAWRRLRRPCRATLDALERAGAKVQRPDPWPEYKPVLSRRQVLKLLEIGVAPQKKEAA